MNLNLAFIGFGTVGQGLAEILLNKKTFLEQEHDFQYTLVAISDTLKGSVYDEHGLDLSKILALAKDRGGQLDHYPTGHKGWDSLKTIRETNADVIIEVSYTDVKTAEPATSHVKAAFENGKHVVTTNKGPSALHHRELDKMAKERNVFYGIEGTVMSGTPVLNTARKSLAGCSINRIRGILNGTTNYILTRMEDGDSYQEALREAQRLGYAEADPTGDVEGWDALAKVMILGKVLMGQELHLDEISRQGIAEITAADIERTKAKGARLKLIGEIRKENGEVTASVRPQRLALTDPLANIAGATNAITFETDLVGPVTIVGAGAGKTATGFALLADLLEINRSQRSSAARREES